MTRATLLTVPGAASTSASVKRASRISPSAPYTEAATRSRDASTVSVAKKVRKVLEETNKTLPKGTVMEVTQDGGEAFPFWDRYEEPKG